MRPPVPEKQEARHGSYAGGADFVSLGVIARWFPRRTVDRVVRESGKTARRERDLPAPVAVCSAIAPARSVRSSCREAFGYPRVSRGTSGFPRPRFVCLIENGAHVLFASRLRPCATGAIAPAKQALQALQKGMPRLADGSHRSALDELKTHPRGARIVLRGKTPELVRQELYGLLPAHFAIRGLLHAAAPEGRRRSGSIAYLHAVRVVRRKPAQAAAIPLGTSPSFMRPSSRRCSRSASVRSAASARRTIPRPHRLRLPRRACSVNRIGLSSAIARGSVRNSPARRRAACSRTRCAAAGSTSRAARSA